MEKIEAWQVFWSILTSLISYIAIMVTFFIRKLSRMETKIDGKVNLSDCKEIRTKCAFDCRESRKERDRSHHVHGQEGKAGEVVPK